MSLTDLSGTGVALITPFKSDLSIDYDALQKLLEHVVKGKVEFLVVMGTTGESPTLTAQEKKEILQFVIDKTNNQVPVIYGIGGNSTQEVIEDIQQTDLSNVSAILSVAPYYNKPSQEGIFLHYKAIAEATPKPVILYNVPGRTASNIESTTTLRLAEEVDNIIAIKEASGDFTQIMNILKNKPEGFQVLSGDDALTFPMMALGATGVITVIANAYPFEYSEMVRLLNSGKIEQAKEYHFKLLDIMHAQFEEGSPAGIKATLDILKIAEPYVRLPLAPASGELKNKLIQLTNEL